MHRHQHIPRGDHYLTAQLGFSSPLLPILGPYRDTPWGWMSGATGLTPMEVAVIPSYVPS